MEIQNLGTKKFRIRIIRVTAITSGISKTAVLGRFSLDRSSSAREYLCIELTRKKRLHQEYYARSCRELNNWEHAAIFDECMLRVRAQCFHDKWAERKGYHKEQSGLSTAGGNSVLAVVNVHVVNSGRWLHLWFLVRCRLQCAMNNSWVSVVRMRCQETRRSSSDVEVVTSFARDFNPSVALRCPLRPRVQWSLPVPQLSTFHTSDNFLQFAEINPLYGGNRDTF